MKKITTTKKEKDFYNIETIIDGVAIIKSSISGKTGLLDIKKNMLIGELDYYNIKADEQDKLYYQIKNVDDSKVISIYDIVNKKYLVCDFEIVGSLIFAASDIIFVYILKSPVDGKIHLFDVNNCRDKDNIFNKQLNNATYIIDSHHYKLTDTNDKKALYSLNKGLVTEFEYDNIEKEEDVIIYTKETKKSFSTYDYNGISNNIIGEFNEIKSDKKIEQLLYCKDEEYTSIYDLKVGSFILKEPRDLECIARFIYLVGFDSLNYEYLFIGTDKYTKKKSLISVMYEEKTEEVSKKYLAKNYDAINIDHFLCSEREGILYLESNKKLDLFIGGFNHYNLLELKSDKIEHLGKNCYAITKDGCTDIIEADDTLNKIAIKNCNIKDKSNDAIIYSQKNNEGKELEGIFYFEDSEYHGDIYKKNVPATCDKISHIDYCLYLAEVNDNKGMYCFGRLIIPIDYKDIEIAFSSKDSRIDLALYFSLKKGNSNILAKRDIGYDINSDRNNELEVLGKYKDILFFKDIIVLKTVLNTIIYDYNDKILGEFPFDTTVTSFEVPEDNFSKKTIYCINDDYYFYKDGNLEKYYKEDIDMYLTTYETDTEMFEATSYKKDILDKFTNYIDSMEDDLGETSLKELSNNKRELEDKYPSLVLRKVKKKEVK